MIQRNNIPNLGLVEIGSSAMAIPLLFFKNIIEVQLEAFQDYAADAIAPRKQTTGDIFTVDQLVFVGIFFGQIQLRKRRNHTAVTKFNHL
jgi:hypothetical protein